MKRILSYFGLSAVLGMLLFSNAWAEEPKETTTKDGVHLVWQHAGERVAYWAYRVKSPESGIFELYWVCDGLKNDSERNSTTYIVNVVPNGPVEDTANVIIEEIPWENYENNQRAVLATIDWTNWKKEGTRETYAGEPSGTALTPEPVKNISVFRNWLSGGFNKLPADQPFKLLTLNPRIENEQKPEIWELYGNWLSQDKLIKEFRETKSFRSLSWLLANAVRNDMKREKIVKLLGPGTNLDEKMDKWFREVCEKRGLAVQKDDVFVMYEGAFLQFRNGILVNHKPEEYANPQISYAISVPKK
jgi:hypothetical protein